MGALLKLIIGAILMIAAVWWVIPGQGGSTLLIKRNAINDLISLLNAAVPIGIFFIGLFVVWLELDEIKIEREIKSEGKKKKK
jgi:hypothetical protein